MFKNAMNLHLVIGLQDEYLYFQFSYMNTLTLLIHLFIIFKHRQSLYSNINILYKPSYGPHSYSPHVICISHISVLAELNTDWTREFDTTYKLVLCSASSKMNIMALE